MHRIWLLSLLLIGAYAYLEITPLTPTTSRTEYMPPGPDNTVWDPVRYSLFIPLYAKNFSLVVAPRPIGVDCAAVYFYYRTSGILCENLGFSYGTLCQNHYETYTYDFETTTFEFSQGGESISKAINMDYSIGVSKYGREDSVNTCSYNITTFFEFCPFDQIGYPSDSGILCTSYTNATLNQNYTITSDSPALFRYVIDKYTGNISFVITSDVYISAQGTYRTPIGYDKCSSSYEQIENDTWITTLVCDSPDVGDFWLTLSADTEYMAEVYATGAVCPQGTMGNLCQYPLVNLRDLPENGTVYSIADGTSMYFYIDYVLGETTFYNVSFGSVDNYYIYYSWRYGNIPTYYVYDIYDYVNTTFIVTPYDTYGGKTSYFSIESELGYDTTVEVKITSETYIVPTTTTGTVTTGTSDMATSGTSTTGEMSTSTVATTSTTGSMEGSANALVASVLSAFVVVVAMFL